MMKARNPGTADWESLCARCGLCCYEKVETDSGAIFFTRTPCRYLDIVTRQCKVYERRFAVNPECVKLTPELVKTIRWLHDECGYRSALGLNLQAGEVRFERPSVRKTGKQSRRNR